MKRRKFITLVGGAAAWSLLARAQQGEQMRRIGVLMSAVEGDQRGKRKKNYDRPVNRTYSNRNPDLFSLSRTIVGKDRMDLLRYRLSGNPRLIAFDDMRNPIQNIYIKKVEKKKLFGYDKDELWNTVIKIYPHVSQFWTYDKTSFLAQP